MIVPWQPGSLDVYVRMMTPILQAELGQPIITETKPGATACSADPSDQTYGRTGSTGTSAGRNGIVAWKADR